MILLALSFIVMPLLARAKRRVGEQLGGDQLILADAAESDEDESSRLFRSLSDAAGRDLSVLRLTIRGPRAHR
jgi:hypothetical protein